MQLSIDELREMIREAINQQILEEGPFSNRLAQYQNASQNIIDKYRSRTDAVVDRGSQTSTPTAAPAAPTAPLAPAGDLDDTEPIRPAEPIDPEDMIEPTQPPAGSEDASLKTIFELYEGGFDYGAGVEGAIGTFGALMALGKVPSAEDIADLIAPLGPMFEKKYELGKVAQGANNYSDLMLRAEEADVENEMVNYMFFFPLSNDFQDLPESTLSVTAKQRSERLKEIAEEFRRRDSKTGATPQLLQFIRSLSLSDGFRVTDGALLRETYPAMLRIAISSGGQKAGENLKDILIAMEYMKPEETGRDKEGMFSRFVGTGRTKRRQAADDIYAQIYDEDD
jgi:hypothetical protein